MCSRAAQYLTQKEIGNKSHTTKKSKSFYCCIDQGLKVHLLPEKLLQSIETLLNDTQEHVRTAAAIALVTLNRFSPQVLF